MEAGLMEIVRSLNRSWIYDTYFSLGLHRAIHPGGKVRGNVRIPIRSYFTSKHSAVFLFFLLFHQLAFDEAVIIFVQAYLFLVFPYALKSRSSRLSRGFRRSSRPGWLRLLHPCRARLHFSIESWIP